VDDVSAAEDRDAMVAEGSEACRQVEVVIQRFQDVDRELDDGHVGGGVEVREDAPGAVIQAPLVVVQADPLRLDHLGDLCRHVRGAGRRILECKELGRESVEIVDRART
jgi:hypothetical protein